MQKYGVTYQGSKNLIAERLIERLPAGQRFVDLFGGGFAMSHCALLSGKYKQVLYNELNPLLTDLIKRAIKGEFNPDKFKPEWISRDKFNELKEKDGYVKYIWSYGGSGENYLYSKEIEPYKKAYHCACLGDFLYFHEFYNFPTNLKTRLEIRQHIGKNFETIKKNYIEWYKKKFFQNAKVIEELEADTASKKERLRAYLITERDRNGLKSSDVDKFLGTQMSGHYYTKSQWEFPTFEVYQKLDEIMHWSKGYPITYFLAQKLQNRKTSQILENLQRLQRLQNLESLESLERLEITDDTYLNYKHRSGDVVYCDPPYENTIGYDTEFNHAQFYNWVNSREYPVYFSSYPITDDRFTIIAQIPKRQLYSSTNSGKVMQETIYANKAALQSKIIELEPKQLELKLLYA